MIKFSQKINLKLKVVQGNMIEKVEKRLKNLEAVRKMNGYIYGMNTRNIECKP